MPEFNIVSEVRKRIVATDAAFASELKTELDLPANRLTNQHRQVVRSWRVKPTFAYKITLAGSKVTVTVFARGQYRWHYIWTDKGTKKHTITAKTGKVLSFKTGYRARTKPIARYGVGSGQANGKRVFAQTVKHPGTAARKFSETFGKKIAPDIRKAMDNAFKRAIRKGRG